MLRAVDEFLSALGVQHVGPAITITKAVATTLRSWARGDEVTNLFLELESRLEDVPGFTATALGPLREDVEFLQLLALYWQTAEFPREPMVSVLEAHLGETATASPRDLAEQLADAIELFSARARKKDRELFAIEAFRQNFDARLEELRVDLRRRDVRHVTIDWVPALGRDRLKRLLDESPGNLAPLEDELKGLADPRRRIVGLIGDPPGWLDAEDDYRTWAAVGEVADTYGLFTDAAHAFLRASELPGADRPKLIARAAVCFRLADDQDRYEELLTRARELDPRNAQVVLAEVAVLSDPNDRLARLSEAVDDGDPRNSAALLGATAVAHLERRDWDSADQAIDELETIQSDHLAIRALRPRVAIERNRERAALGNSVDPIALADASGQLEALRNDLNASFRHEEAGRTLAQAIEALALADDDAGARRLLDEISAEELQDAESTADLAHAALLSGAQDRALALLEGLDDERSALLRVEAVVHAGDAESIAAVLPELDRLVSDAVFEPVRHKAAYIRQVAAIDPEIDPSPDAQRMVEAEEPAIAALLAAERLYRTGEEDKAERTLRPHQTDVRVLRTLARWAGRRQDWNRVLDLSRAIIAQGPIGIDRLVFADALVESDRLGEALLELGSVARDANVEIKSRLDAYARLADLYYTSNDFERLETVAREWLSVDGSSEAAPWALLLALHRLARPEAGLELAQELSLEPRDEFDAAVLAALYDQAADRPRAAQAIAQLSDRFDRPERLEAHFLFVALRVSPEEHLDGLGDEVSGRLAAFTERFPESRLARMVPMETSPEGVDAFIREFVEPGAQATQQVSEDVANGRAPLVALAATMSKPVSLIRYQAQGVLLGLGDPVLAALEVESANAAIGRAVVWDATAVATVAALPGDVADVIRRELPGSLIAQAALDDVAEAAGIVVRDSEASLVMGYDPVSQKPWIRDVPVEETARIRAQSDAALGLARELFARPNVDPTSPTQYDELFQEAGRSPFTVWPASLALAARERRPLFSDDPYVREHARLSGVQSFGTLALLDALESTSRLATSDREQSRSVLRERGVFGLDSSLEELLAEARGAGWRLTDGLIFAFHDRTQWRQQTPDAFRRWAEFLAVAYDEARDDFATWVMRFIDAAARGLPKGSYAFASETLLLVAWQPFRSERRAFVQALIEALRLSQRAFAWFPDPVQGVAKGFSSADEKIRAQLVRAFLRDLGFHDQLELLGLSLS
jgi:hypothetical protein